MGRFKEKALSWTTIITALVLLISTLYLLYGILSGYLPKYDFFPRVQRLQILTSVKTMLLLFQVSSIVISLLLLSSYYDDANKLTWVGLLGAFAYFGIPMICSWSLLLHAGSFNYAIRIVSHSFRTAGMVILLIIALPMARILFLSLREAALKKAERVHIPTAKKVTVKRLTLFSKCWELPYCYGFLRQRCPAYKARKTCWKLRKGCYCDPSVTESLLKGVRASDLVYQKGLTTKRTTITCRRCPIYFEHQRLKYKAVQPLVYPATGIVMWAVFPLLKFLYLKGASLLAHFFSRLSYAGPAAFKPWEEALSSPFSMGIFVTILGLLLLIGLIKLTDYLVLEVKI